MLPSISIREYADRLLDGRQGIGIVALVWHDAETGQVVLDEWKGSDVGNKLKHLLSELVYEAELRPGVPQRLNLSSGLKVDVLLTREINQKLPTPSRMTKLQISRMGVYPSANEWRIIARDWPYPVPDGVHPRETEHAGRCYLRAEWPAPLQLFDGYLSETK